MFPNQDKLAHGDKEPISATILLALLPAIHTVLIRNAGKIYGLSAGQTLTLLGELHRERIVMTDKNGMVVITKLEK